MRKRHALFLVLLGGCASQQVDPAILAESREPLTCTGKQQCDFYWQRAQAYVNQHSNYRIQSATDTIIVTSGPEDVSRNLAYKLTKTPNQDGSATINIQLSCSDYILGCSPTAPVETVNLRRFIRSQQ